MSPPGAARPLVSHTQVENGMSKFQLALVAVGLALATSAPAADPPPEEKTGLKVGEKAQAFKLKDQAGKERELSEFVKQGKVALVFYRSTSW